MRDIIALVAMHGMLASWDRGNSGRLFDEDVIAQDAYGVADAMMRVRAAPDPSDPK